MNEVHISDYKFGARAKMLTLAQILLEYIRSVTGLT